MQTTIPITYAVEPTVAIPVKQSAMHRPTRFDRVPAKAVVRALIRALSDLARADEEAASYDAHFDGGEWSSAHHGPGMCDAAVDAILSPLGLTREQADEALKFWATLDRTPDKPWYCGQPEADCLRAWLATEEEVAS